MYKPPENTNRVKAIKSKFENNENASVQLNNIKPVKNQPVLSRQLSDPVKVNIKRTPAFRNDKQFQRNGVQVSCRSKGAENKVLYQTRNRSASPQKPPLKMSNSLDVKSSASVNTLRKQFDSQEDLTKKMSKYTLRERSNTSAEIIINRQRSKINLMKNENKKCSELLENFDKTMNKNFTKNVDNGKSKEEVLYENISILYTEPIPKSLRTKENHLNIHNSSTLKIGDKISNPTLISTTNDKNFISYKNGSCDDIHYKLNALTDTLKLALKKPLPPGPAPKKPPRTFAHVSPDLQISQDFEKRLNSTLQKGQRKLRSDPKYMLDKLENALKNNKIRLKRQAKIEYTSEEDNSDSNDKMPLKSNNRMNLNCLQSLSCSNATYEAVCVSQSSHPKYDEPVYAEPFVFPQNEQNSNVKNRTDCERKFNRNSLYYMSTLVAASNESECQEIMDDSGLNHSDGGDETSSTSTPTSDIDSLTSSPSEENKKVMSSKIRNLIKSFEKPVEKNFEKRVDKLGMQLRETIERSFTAVPIENPESEIAERSSTEGESSDAKVGEYETYVRTIRNFSKLRKKCDGKHLFYGCLLVGLNGNQPYIKFKFPKNVEFPSDIEKLCFPDAIDSNIDYSVKAQNYTLVLTNNVGERIYGYCRRVLPEDSTKCLPLAYCILSKQRASRFYKRILEELESHHGIPDKVRDTLLNEFYYHQFPAPGESVRFNLLEVNKHLTSVKLLDEAKSDIMKSTDSAKSYNSRHSTDSDVDLSSYVFVNDKGVYGTLNKKNQRDTYNKRNGIFFHNGIIPPDLIQESETTSISTPTELIITLHQDSRYKEKDLEELCNTLENDILLRVFASLLIERKVIFISSSLGKLSTCIEAIQSMLYPFSWPHTLIPVIPKDLLEIVEAPTPLICGTLALNPQEYEIEHGIVVDLDKGKVLKEVGDEGKIIPCTLLKEFKEGMSLAHAASRENEGAFNVLLSDAFIRIFIHSCGNYRDFLKDNTFQKEDFIMFPKSKNVRRFLKWFTETTMFCTFIDTALSNKCSFQIFDERIQIYRSRDVGMIIEKMKDWKKEKNYLFF